MGINSKIEWTENTFNPWIGCAKISPACDHCYAADLSARTFKVKWGAGEQRKRTSESYWKQPLKWNREVCLRCKKCGWRGNSNARPEMYVGSTSNSRPRCPSCGVFDWGAQFERIRPRVFCASLADVFDNEVDPQWRADLFSLVTNTPNLDWMILTKRIGNAEKMMQEACDLMDSGMGVFAPSIYPNVHLGITICNQTEADRDIPKLLATSAAKRFLSIEPMLGPIDLEFALSRNPIKIAAGFLTRGFFSPGLETLRPIDLVIVGGESGPHARPSHPDWFRSLRDQCAAASVPFMFKQWGEWCPRGPESMGYASVEGVKRIRLTDLGENGGDLCARGDNHVWMNRAGKKAAGRLLDGMHHNGRIAPQNQTNPSAPGHGKIVNIKIMEVNQGVGA